MADENSLIREASDYAVRLISAHNGWGLILVVVIFIVVVVGIGRFISWFVAQLRGEADRDKILAEGTKLHLENLEKFQKYEIDYEEAQRLLDLHIVCLSDAFRRGDPVGIEKAREEIIDYLVHDYMRSWGSFLDCYVRCRPRKDCVRYIKTNILKALSTIDAACLIIDNPSVLSKMNKAPLRFSQQSLWKVWGFCEKLYLWNVPTMWRVSVFKNKFRED